MKLSQLQDCFERLKCEHGDIDIVTEGMDGIGTPCLTLQDTLKDQPEDAPLKDHVLLSYLER